MGMSSALNAGVTGLNVQTSRLAAISDNIANSATYGYKRAEVDFSSIVLGATSGKYDAGGVRSTALRVVDARGSLVTTTNATDIAITGRGLLPVTTVTQRDESTDTRPLYLVSTGSFYSDEDGYLRTANGLQLLGWPAPNGETPTGVTRASGADLQPVRIAGFDFASNPTSEVQVGVNLPAGGDVGSVYSTGVEYYSSLGGSETLTLQFTKTADNAWTMRFADDQTGLVVGDFQVDITFHPDDNGGTVDPGSIATITVTDGAGPNGATLVDNGDGTLALSLNDGTIAQTITLDIGEPDTLGPLTQFSSGFAPVALTKNGNPVGTLARVEVDEQGYVEAIYDTGFRQRVFQIPVADVPNLNGLEALDNQAFKISSDSGSIYFWDAGSGPTGDMTGFALEQSTTDIAAELTQLIETQRAYTSNATIVRTVDEMLQETTNLKR